jgi:hypothetical protein
MRQRLNIRPFDVHTSCNFQHDVCRGHVSTLCDAVTVLAATSTKDTQEHVAASKPFWKPRT